MARAHTLLPPYFYMIHCNNNKSLYDQIDSKLIGPNIYWKKKSQTVMIDKDNNCTFSVIYSLLKIKSKAYIFENIFTIFKWQNKSRQQKSANMIQWFCFWCWQLRRHLPNARKTAFLMNFAHSNLTVKVIMCKIH